MANQIVWCDIRFRSGSRGEVPLNGSRPASREAGVFENHYGGFALQRRQGWRCLVQSSAEKPSDGVS